MGKLALIMLIVSLTLSIVSAGQAKSKAVFEPTLASAIADEPISAPALFYSGTSNASSSGNRFGSVDAQFNPPELTESSVEYPAIPGRLITGLLCDCIQQPCWMQLAQNQRQIHGFARNGYGTQLTGSGGCKLAQQGGQLKLAIVQSLSGSLSSLSPPGLISRL